ncbi:YrzI family small protein [Ferdinandcohnia sp. Marseille-Q9671]
MTINLFFLTISISTRKRSIEQLAHEEQVSKRMEEMKDRQYSMMRPY